MQDYPKSLGGSAAVGFSTVNGTINFSPVKTNLVDAQKKIGVPTANPTPRLLAAPTRFAAPSLRSVPGLHTEWHADLLGAFGRGRHLRERV